jgi:hypothetical protein
LTPLAPRAGRGRDPSRSDGRVRGSRRLCIAAVALITAASASFGQRLLLGSWQAKLNQSTATLVIITADGEGWVHGILRYEPPQQDGFAGSPFTTHIENGAFSVRLVNGTRYDDLHWCRDELCGVFHAQDDATTPIAFARPPN